MSPQTFGESQRPANVPAPSSRVFGNRVDVFVPGEHRAGRLWPPAREPWVAVGRIADQSEPIRYGGGPNPELRQHRCFVIHDVTASIPTDHLLARNELGEIF